MTRWTGNKPPPEPEWVFAQMHREEGAVWLDSGTKHSGWSIMTCHPVQVIGNSPNWLQDGRELTRATKTSEDLPFESGCIGYVGYNAGYQAAPVPMSPPTPEPEVWLGRYEGALCYNHSTHTWHITGGSQFQEQGHHWLHNAAPLSTPSPAPKTQTTRTTEKSDYEAKVNQILQWIKEGDCYQVNLSRAVHLSPAGCPWEAYRRLRSVSSAPMGAYLNVSKSQQILSNSPELFLKLRQSALLSCPIKGTRPRGPSKEKDNELAEQLLHSRKDQAELAMIVDLLRNDFSRVSVVGTVQTGSRTLTSHANVHHASTQVSGTLRKDEDAWSALAAAFPPGSVTGTPKVRACQRIHQLEQEGRGAYCGAIGYIADGGSGEWSVAIRTAIFSENTGRYHVGGGIVADSKPEEEWEETISKGKMLDQALIG